MIDLDGNFYVYDLVIKWENIWIEIDKILYDLGIIDGEMIFFIF